MKNFDFWTKWLILIGLLLVLFGLALAVFNQSLLFEILFNSNVDPVFWGLAAVPPASQNFQRWAYAVLGATVAGWGVFLTFLAYFPFHKKELWAWNCILVGMLVWYFPDTILSMLYGVVFNAVFNTLLLVLILLPLIFTHRHFSGGPARHRSRHSRKEAA